MKKVLVWKNFWNSTSPWARHIFQLMLCAIHFKHRKNQFFSFFWSYRLFNLNVKTKNIVVLCIHLIIYCLLLLLFGESFFMVYISLTSVYVVGGFI